MNTNQFIPFHPSDIGAAIAAADTAKKMLAALYAAAKAQNAAEPMARISEVQGLYAAYEMTSSPEIVDAIVVKLGNIIGEFLKTSSPALLSAKDAETKRRAAAASVAEFNERVFMEGAPRLIYMKDWQDAYVQYLESCGLSPQTVRIYKSKAAAALSDKEEYMDIAAMKRTLVRIQETDLSDKKDDHNAACAVRRFLEFLDTLERNVKRRTDPSIALSAENLLKKDKKPEITDFYGARVHAKEHGWGKLTRVYGEEIYVTFDSGKSYIYKENAFEKGALTFDDPGFLEPFNKCYLQYTDSDAGRNEIYDTWFKRGS